MFSSVNIYKKQNSALEGIFLILNTDLIMPFHRNFTYYIDKRKWKYIFLLATLELSGKKSH